MDLWRRGCLLIVLCSMAPSARAQDNPARALRAKQLAEATTTLAARRLARLREVQAMTSTLVQREQARAEVSAARESLEAARRLAAEAP